MKENPCDPVLNKWNLVFDSIKYQIKDISNEKINFNGDFNKIKFISDDFLAKDQLIYFPTLSVVIRFLKKKISFILKFI